MAAHDRPHDRPGDRSARPNARNGHRDDAIVVPPRRPTAARAGDGRPTRTPRTELEARGRPAGPVRFPELSEWAASRQVELDRDVEEAAAAVPGASTTTDLVPAVAAVALVDTEPLTTVVPRFPVLGSRPLIDDRGPPTAPIRVGPTTIPIALPPSPPVVPAPALSPAPEAVAPAAAVAPTATRPTTQIVSTRRSILRRRPRVRRVSRVVRRIDAWSVLKVSLILYALAYLILLVAGVLLWKVAIETGTLANVEGFVKELFGLTTFELHGKELYKASWTVGAFMVVAGTGLNVTAAVMFNLITDLVGGVRVTVLEEEVRLVERGPSRRARRATARAMQDAAVTTPAPPVAEPTPSAPVFPAAAGTSVVKAD